MVAISSIAQTSIAKDIGVSLSLSLGNMNSSSRVSHIASGSSIESSYGGHCSRGQACNVEGSRGGDLGVSSMVSQRSSMGDHRGSMGISMASISQTSISQTSISQAMVAISSIAQTSIAKDIGVSLSLS